MVIFLVLTIKMHSPENTRSGLPYKEDAHRHGGTWAFQPHMPPVFKAAPPSIYFFYNPTLTHREYDFDSENVSR